MMWIQLPSQCLAKFEYCKVKLEGLNKSLPALKDSGAQISLIRQDLIKDLDVPTLGVISVRGVVGSPVRANLVTTGIKPQPNDGFENIAPYVPIIFAACEMTTDLDIILSSSVVEQLNDLAAYEVIQPQGNSMNRDRSDGYADDQNDHRKSCEIAVGAVTTRAMSRQQNQSIDQDIKGHDDDSTHLGIKEMMSLNDSFDETQIKSDEDARNAFISEQRNNESLKTAWVLAENNKANYFVKDGILSHRDKVCGLKVEQVCLPTSRRNEVCRLAHDMSHQGVKKTNEKNQDKFSLGRNE